MGIVVEAVAQDLWFGGNEFTIAATKEYFKGNQLIANGVDNEVAPSVTAFKRAEDLMQRALNNQYYDRDLNITLDTIGDPPICLLYTSPSPRDGLLSRMPSSA